jgi:hypothetical protein
MALPSVIDISLMFEAQISPPRHAGHITSAMPVFQAESVQNVKFTFVSAGSVAGPNYQLISAQASDTTRSATAQQISLAKAVDHLDHGT